MEGDEGKGDSYVVKPTATFTAGHDLDGGVLTVFEV